MIWRQNRPGHLEFINSSQLSLRLTQTGLANQISPILMMKMEKAEKSNLFPPLAVPEAYRRRKLNKGMSKEGQTVKNELEHRQIVNQFLRPNLISKEIDTDGKANAPRSKSSGEFCVACEQRLCLQPSLRPGTREPRMHAALARERLMGCICIMCKKALPLSPHAAGHHRIIINSNKKYGQKQGKVRALADHTQRKPDAQKGFRISSLDYDSRIEKMQHGLDVEQCMPSKEVMRRSERKCQLWLFRNEEHLKTKGSPMYW